MAGQMEIMLKTVFTADCLRNDFTNILLSVIINNKVGNPSRSNYENEEN